MSRAEQVMAKLTILVFFTAATSNEFSSTLGSQLVAKLKYLEKASFICPFPT